MSTSRSSERAGTRTTRTPASPCGPRGDIRIGISGWRYAPWRGRFYPEGLRQRDELSCASRMLPSIELNGSFYSLQRPESYEAWRDQTPDGFVFAVKGSRYITHMLRLKEVRAALANFFASGVLAGGQARPHPLAASAAHAL